LIFARHEKGKCRPSMEITRPSWPDLIHERPLITGALRVKPRIHNFTWLGFYGGVLGSVA
jgi:hypothetical protein